MTAAETFCASQRTHRAVMRSCCDGGLLSLRLEGDPKRLQCWAVSPLPPRRADHSNAAVHFTRNRAHLRCHSHTRTAPTLTATSLQVFQLPMTLHYIRAKPPLLPHKRVAAGMRIFSAAARAHDAQPTRQSHDCLSHFACIVADRSLAVSVYALVVRTRCHRAPRSWPDP